MGAANVVPGVSGGTVAFITGIYERLLNAIKNFDTKALSLLQRKRFGDFVKHIDFMFLLVLGLGVVVSVFTLAKVLDVLYVSHKIQVEGAFFGLIAMSIYSVAKMVKTWRGAQAIMLLLGCGIAVSLLFVDQAQESRNYAYLALCGAVAMCSMIIPGVSGSFVLILLGNYKLIMIDSVNALRERDLGTALPILAPVGIGAVLGLVILSRLLSWLFKKYNDSAVALITGFVAGSLAIIWPWKEVVKWIEKEGEIKPVKYALDLPDWSNSTTWMTIGCMVAGAAVMFLMDKLGSKKPA